MPLNFKEDKRYCHLTDEQMRYHFVAEKSLRQKILKAIPEDRNKVIQWAYDELFKLVPWHPALTENSGADATNIIENKVKIFLPFLSPPPLKILEIGCGMGELSFGLAKYGYFAIGIDISLVRISRLLKLQTKNLSFVRADAVHLPFDDVSFDAVISMQLFEHLHPEDAGAHLREVARVLRKHGCYFLETPNRLVGPGDVSRFFVDGDAQGFHLKEYSINEMVKIFHQNLFLKVDVVLWKSRRISERKAILLEKIWSIFPKNYRRKHTMGLHNPIFVAYKK